MSARGRTLVTGATGLVGARLLSALLDAGNAVAAVTRRPDRAGGSDPRAERVGWDGLRLSGDALAGTQALVHLAGEPVFGGPPTAARRRRILDSRVESTRALVDALTALPAGDRPDVFVCASAVGYYGSRGESVLDEDAGPGEGFLAEVCVAWEREAARAEALGVRRVSLRIGIVLAREGGALAPLARLFRLGLGGPLGDGRQWVPWIHVDDLVALLVRSLADETLVGALNAVAPNPVRNAELTRELAARLRRPALLRVPGFAVRMGLGELASELVGSRRVVPRRAEEHGFRFQYPTLEEALRAELAG
jgi:uncharacterized protein (TIGR01777 family)